MDRALDEIVAERHRGGGRARGPGRRGGRRNERTEYPRDGVRKILFQLASRINTALVDDASRGGAENRLEKIAEILTQNGFMISLTTIVRVFDGLFGNISLTILPAGRRSVRQDRRYSPEPVYETSSAKLRVENLHYDLTEEDLDDLFNRIGPVLKLSLTYDRAGRSEGVAYVTYESSYDAKKAIREFDGANAKGQPIRLVPIPSGPSAGRRNPAPAATRGSLFDRITPRARSDSPIRHSDVSGPPPSNVDRYVPGRGSRSRSPRRTAPKRDGRRPGARRERGERTGGGGGGRGGERLAKDGRPRKTQEELDAEMEDYFGGGGGRENGASEVTEAKGDDVDMLEIL
ncbi:RNA-binding domain-containing protein [Mollisia scopiformis]|uniref:RNA-binding domain-containing protein n=1 Tax=Mollisia scopiformis TaxID=149040 RepID=A0A194XRF8_MOLSC|nr:RNA-binding domain-containing protein [Mollisia scopiformis]KUJ22875.1 RNA-binding domain-containing protein [Mollisia scopiformis]